MKYSRESLPSKIELQEGEAYVRYQGYTYRIDLQYFKLEAKQDSLTDIELRGLSKGPI